MRVLLVAYDNDDFISWFPIGMAYITSGLIRQVYEFESDASFRGLRQS